MDLRAPVLFFLYILFWLYFRESEQLPPKGQRSHLMVHIPAQTVQVGRDGDR